MAIDRRNGLKILVTSAVAMLAPPRAWAQPVYSSYFNRRYEYSIDYPSDVLIPQGEAPNGDGQAFVSRDKSAALKVWGEINALEKSLAQRYSQASQTGAERRATYHVLNQREQWFVVSGTQGAAIFYQKTMINRELRILNFILTTPASQSAEWSAHTQRIAKSFRRDV